jgi:dTDP-4-dehydrorhamnose reductase
MRVLITGAKGQLGTELVAVCTAAGDDVIATDLDVLDVSSRDQTLGAVTSMQPDIVLHTAAWTDVDGCERDPDRAYLANALAGRNVAEACRLAGSHLLGISTSYVFDGTKVGAYNEWDTPNPQSVYGRSKLAGELEIVRGCAGASIVRISWLCSPHGPNLVQTILRLIADRDRTLSFVDDQVSCPTFTSDLAPLVRQIAVARVPGTFHATSARAVSAYDFAREVVTAAGHDPARVHRIAAADIDPPRPAPRPANDALHSLALRGAGFDPLPDFAGPLGRLVKELLDG